MFARGQTLMAQPFDAAKRRLGGEPFPVAERVSWQGDRYVSASSSTDGTLAYGQGGVPTIQQITWFNRDGTTSGLLGDPTSYAALSLSPDEKHVVVARGTGSASIDLWLFNVASGNATRLTSDPGLEASPVWSPAGDRIVYQSEQGGKSSLRVIQIDGTNDQPVLESGANDIPTSWSGDSKQIVFSRRGPNGRSDIWAVPMFGDRKPFAVVQTGFDETSGVLSPDGRWIAFTSDERGEQGVFVQAFPGPGIRHPISEGGGHHPIWRADGRELFYLSDSGNPGANLMAVSVNLAKGVEVGKPRPLFRAGAPRFFDGQIYAVTKNGERFLVNARPERPVTEPLTIVINWTAALKK
jgi:Tol biopolymer transport system component